MDRREVLSYLPAPEFLLAGLMVVVLGVAVLPSYWRASTQSDIALARSEMGVLGAALEAYRVDHGVYPPCNRTGATHASSAFDGFGMMYLERLSTPVAYIESSRRTGPFNPIGYRNASTAAAMSDASLVLMPHDPDWSFYYQSWNGYQRYPIPPDAFANPSLPRESHAWLLQSAGPDLGYYNMAGVLANDQTADGPILLFYDPTNGTLSRGSLFRHINRIESSPPEYSTGAGFTAAHAIAGDGVVPGSGDLFLLH